MQRLSLVNLHPRASELSIATADGAGAGRFFTLALLDALGGSALAAIRVQPVSPAPGTWSIDFGFYCGDGAPSEVIRAGLNQAGHVVAAELLRAGPETARGYRRQGALAEALRAGHSVESIQLETHASGSPETVALAMDTQDAFLIDLREFDRLLDGP